MAKEYEVGEKYYLPVGVKEIDSGYLYSVRIVFNNGDGNNEGHNAIKNEPDLLMTAGEVARANGLYISLCDEVVAENRELKAKVASLKEDNDRLTAWYKEANKTASEAAEANDDLKAKIAKLRNRVGEQSAQIQDLNAEIHFLKEERDKFAKTAKDKADLANKACTERDAAQGDLATAKAAIDYLQEENTKLKQELKDAEASYNVVADTSIKRKNRATTMEEVIVALVEKIRRLEGDD